MTPLTGRTLEQDQAIRGGVGWVGVLLIVGWAENEEKAEVRWKEQTSTTRILELQYAIKRDEWGQRSAGQQTAMRSVILVDGCRERWRRGREAGKLHLKIC